MAIKQKTKRILTEEQLAKVAELKKLEQKEKEMVRGKFIFHEVPGGQMGFPYKKYASDELKNYTMVDGQIYTIPLGVAKHLNSNCAYPTYNYKNDEAGRPVMSLSEKVRRCSFQSLEFFDLNDSTSASNKYSHSALPSF